MSDLIQINYEITCRAGDSIKRLSADIALEQTVEVPDDCVSSEEIRENIVGKVLEIIPIQQARNCYRVVIGYSPEITGYQIPQFLNTLFGNISLKNNIRIVDFALPDSFLNKFSGPNYGIEGLRRLIGIFNRPLAATALKPMGSDAASLAAMAEAFALGGGDIIKDDHGLADHSFCPFEERVCRCQEAIERANSKTGRKTLYFPNVINSQENMEAQVEFAVKQGIRGVVISPFLVGPDMLRYLAAKYPLAFMAHPAFTGTHFHNLSHGMKPAVLLGTLFRILGADISVFPNTGGRFFFTTEECRQLSEALKRPFGKLKPAFPAPAGGMNFNNINGMAEQYGQDAIYVIGRALLMQFPDLTESTRKFMGAINRCFQERRVTPENNTISSCELPDMDLRGEVLEHLVLKEDFHWAGRELHQYKEEDTFDFKSVTRQELIGRYGEKTSFDLRYFQIEPGGYSSLEKHMHEHVIICIRGQGVLIQGKSRINLKTNEIAYVPPFKVHQLRNEGDKPFGFLCIVDHVRDKPVKP